MVQEHFFPEQACLYIQYICLYDTYILWKCTYVRERDISKITSACQFLSIEKMDSEVPASTWRL